MGVKNTQIREKGCIVSYVYKYLLEHNEQIKKELEKGVFRVYISTWKIRTKGVF